MTTSYQSTTQDEMDKLLEIWKVLEVLTVSLDRIGMHETLAGKAQGHAALAAFIEPPLFHRIAAARALAQELLAARDPHIATKLESLSDDEDAMGYWREETPGAS